MIINSHVHLEDIHLLQQMGEILKNHDTYKMCILSYAKGAMVNANIVAAAAKCLRPKGVFAFGGMDYSCLFADMRQKAPDLLSRQLKSLMNMGFDGVKLFDLKPTEFFKSPFRLDDPVFEPFFFIAQEQGIPIICHIADPENLWDSEKVPQWARKEGWFYGTRDYPTRETIYHIFENIMTRFPYLKLILAHFGFLSCQLEYLAELFDAYPNLSVDLAPGVNLYLDFSKNNKLTREFFIKYQDRIIFGTDLELGSLEGKEAGFELDEMVMNINLVRKFVEYEKTFQMHLHHEVLPITGIGLEQNILNKIYHENFEKLVGIKPKPISYEFFQNELTRVETYLARKGVAEKNNFAKQVSHILLEFNKL